MGNSNSKEGLNPSSPPAKATAQPNSKNSNNNKTANSASSKGASAASPALAHGTTVADPPSLRGAHSNVPIHPSQARPHPSPRPSPVPLPHQQYNLGPQPFPAARPVLAHQQQQQHYRPAMPQYQQQMQQRPPPPPPPVRHPAPTSASSSSNSHGSRQQQRSTGPTPPSSSRSNNNSNSTPSEDEIPTVVLQEQMESMLVNIATTESRVRELREELDTFQSHQIFSTLMLAWFLSFSPGDYAKNRVNDLRRDALEAWKPVRASFLEDGGQVTEFEARLFDSIVQDVISHADIIAGSHLPPEKLIQNLILVAQSELESARASLEEMRNNFQDCQLALAARGVVPSAVLELQQQLEQDSQREQERRLAREQREREAAAAEQRRKDEDAAAAARQRQQEEEQRRRQREQEEKEKEEEKKKAIEERRRHLAMEKKRKQEEEEEHARKAEELRRQQQQAVSAAAVASSSLHSSVNANTAVNRRKAQSVSVGSAPPNYAELYVKRIYAESPAAFHVSLQEEETVVDDDATETTAAHSHHDEDVPSTPLIRRRPLAPPLPDASGAIVDATEPQPVRHEYTQHKPQPPVPSHSQGLSDGVHPPSMYPHSSTMPQLSPFPLHPSSGHGPMHHHGHHILQIPIPVPYHGDESSKDKPPEAPPALYPPKLVTERDLLDHRAQQEELERLRRQNEVMERELLMQQQQQHQLYLQQQQQLYQQQQQQSYYQQDSSSSMHGGYPPQQQDQQHYAYQQQQGYPQGYSGITYGGMVTNQDSPFNQQNNHPNGISGWSQGAGQQQQQQHYFQAISPENTTTGTSAAGAYAPQHDHPQFQHVPAMYPPQQQTYPQTPSSAQAFQGQQNQHQHLQQQQQYQQNYIVYAQSSLGHEYDLGVVGHVPQSASESPSVHQPIHASAPLVNDVSAATVTAAPVEILPQIRANPVKEIKLRGPQAILTPEEQAAASAALKDNHGDPNGGDEQGGGDTEEAVAKVSDSAPSSKDNNNDTANDSHEEPLQQEEEKEQEEKKNEETVGKVAAKANRQSDEEKEKDAHDENDEEDEEEEVLQRRVRNLRNLNIPSVAPQPEQPPTVVSKESEHTPLPAPASLLATPPKPGPRPAPRPGPRPLASNRPMSTAFGSNTKVIIHPVSLEEIVVNLDAPSSSCSSSLAPVSEASPNDEPEQDQEKAPQPEQVEAPAVQSDSAIEILSRKLETTGLATAGPTALRSNSSPTTSEFVADSNLFAAMNAAGKRGSVRAKVDGPPPIVPAKPASLRAKLASH